MLLTEAVAQRKTAPIYLGRGQQHKFHSLIAAEEEEWDAKMMQTKKKDNNRVAGSFEEYRGQNEAAGVM